jgi:hypothetical protein
VVYEHFRLAAIDRPGGKRTSVPLQAVKRKKRWEITDESPLNTSEKTNSSLAPLTLPGTLPEGRVITTWAGDRAVPRKEWEVGEEEEAERALEG